jgi:hypothetical protein
MVKFHTHVHFRHASRLKSGFWLQRESNLAMPSKACTKHFHENPPRHKVALGLYMYTFMCASCRATHIDSNCGGVCSKRMQTQSWDVITELAYYFPQSFHFGGTMSFWPTPVHTQWKEKQILKPFVFIHMHPRVKTHIGQFLWLWHIQRRWSCICKWRLCSVP